MAILREEWLMTPYEQMPEALRSQRVRALKNRLIVSVQADGDEPLNRPEILCALAETVLLGGADALRMANADNIAFFKQRHPETTVLGITKPKQIPQNYKELVYITPDRASIQAIAEAGADIIALDATDRPRAEGESLAGLVAFAREHFPDRPLMADIATLAEGLAAARLGFDLVATTLAGYTQETADRAYDGPDFQLLDALVRQAGVPVILEGRLWETAEVREAFHLGAYAVVIGSAITRPHHITRRFRQAIPSL